MHQTMLVVIALAPRYVTNNPQYQSIHTIVAWLKLGELRLRSIGLTSASGLG